MTNFLEQFFWIPNGRGMHDMIIHHLATVALFVGATAANEIGIGAIIAWLHLFTEYLIPLSKILGDSKYQNLSGLFYLIVYLPTWLYFRIICLALILYHHIQAENGYQHEELKQYNILRKYLFSIYIGIILQLQVSWFAKKLKKFLSNLHLA